MLAAFFECAWPRRKVSQAPRGSQSHLGQTCPTKGSPNHLLAGGQNLGFMLVIRGRPDGYFPQRRWLSSSQVRLLFLMPDSYSRFGGCATIHTFAKQAGSSALESPPRAGGGGTVTWTGIRYNGLYLGRVNGYSP